MDHTMGNRMAQQQMMSTRWKTSRHVNQSFTDGLSSSMMMMAMLANTWQESGGEGRRQGEEAVSLCAGPAKMHGEM